MLANRQKGWYISKLAVMGKHNSKLMFKLNTVLFIILFINFACGQSSDQIKNFSDTSFKVGDRIIAPEIAFTLSGGSRVVTEYLDSVKVIADFLTEHPNIEVEIGGHTDSRGNSNYNLELSENRANSIREVLINQFNINAERISVKGYGESEPIVKDEELNRASNEREKERLYAIIDELN